MGCVQWYGTSWAASTSASTFATELKGVGAESIASTRLQRRRQRRKFTLALDDVLGRSRPAGRGRSFEKESSRAHPPVGVSLNFKRA